MAAETVAEQRAAEPLHHDYLRRMLRDWLRTPQAARLAAGERAAEIATDYDAISDMASELDLHYIDHLVSNALTPASQQRLRRLIANPDQPVCTADHDGEPRCGLVHVDPHAAARPHLVASAPWYELHTTDRNTWSGAHAHGRISIYRDHAGTEWAEWTDGDPTKGAAWDVWESVNLDEARRLLGLTPQD